MSVYGLLSTQAILNRKLHFLSSIVVCSAAKSSALAHLLVANFHNYPCTLYATEN